MPHRTEHLPWHQRLWAVPAYRVVYDPARRPVEHIHALYRPDRYEYRMSLTRERGRAGNVWAPPAGPVPLHRVKS